MRREREQGREKRRNAERSKTNQRAISSLKWACWGVRNEEKEREGIRTTKTRTQEEEHSPALFLWRSGDSLVLQRSSLIRVRGLCSSFTPRGQLSGWTETTPHNWKEAPKGDYKGRRGRLEGAGTMEANSKKHRFRKGRSATFSIDGFNITIGKNVSRGGK